MTATTGDHATISAAGAHPAVWVVTVTAGAAAALLAGAIAVAIPTAAVDVLEWLIVGTVAGLGAALAVYDATARRLPDRLVFPLYAAVAVLIAACGLLAADPGRVLVAIAAAAILWATYFAFGLAGAVAYGDVKLAGALGLAVGWWGILPALLAAAAAYLLAFPHALAHLASRRRARQIPFGPYMVGSAVVVVVWHHLQP